MSVHGVHGQGQLVKRRVGEGRYDEIESEITPETGTTRPRQTITG